MNRLNLDRRTQVIGALVEGNSIRSTERMTGIHRDTIMRLGAKVGRGCAVLHDRLMVGIRTGRIECDELWSFVGKKHRLGVQRVDEARGDAHLLRQIRFVHRSPECHRSDRVKTPEDPVRRSRIPLSPRGTVTR